MSTKTKSVYNQKISLMRVGRGRRGPVGCPQYKEKANKPTRMPQFGNILMRFTDIKKPPDKRKLFELLQRDLRVHLTALKEVKSGYNAFTEQEGEVQRLLTEEARDKLKTLGLEVKLPPKVKANRAVICRQIDPYVGERSKEEITAEIEHCNSNLRVAELIKFGTHSHVFKVEFTTTEMAQHVIERGFLCCNMRISASQIQRRIYRCSHLLHLLQDG